MSAPSSFIKDIGGLKVYDSMVNNKEIPNIISLVVKKEFKLYGNRRKIILKDYNCKNIETSICNFINGKKSNRGKISKDIQNKIQGVNLNAFADFLDNGNESAVTKGTSCIKINSTQYEVDLLYRGYLIDIKVYKKFTDNNIIKAFTQLFIYYKYLKKDTNVTRFGIYVPTKNTLYYIDNNVNLEPFFKKYDQIVCKSNGRIERYKQRIKELEIELAKTQDMLNKIRDILNG